MRTATPSQTRLALLAPVAVTALAVAEALAVSASAPTAERLAGVALIAPALFARRRAPLAASLFVAVAVAARAAFGEYGAIGFSQAAMCALMAWSAGRWASGRSSVAGIAAGQAGIAGAVALHGEALVNDYLMLGLTVGLCGVAGVAVRRRSEELVRSRVERDRARAERDRQLAEALAEERRRIAREMHDAVGHSLSILSIQVAAARRHVERDAGRARGHVETMRATAGATASELRSLLSAIDEPGDDGVAQPGIADVAALVDATDGAVLLRLRCDDAVPASVGLAAYRIVQEALTNARKHAAGTRVTVEVATEQGCVEIRVRNTLGRSRRSAGPGGHGLVGMAERVRLYRGSLRAGPTDGGGWEVAASLPLQGEPVGHGIDAAPRAARSTA